MASRVLLFAALCAATFSVIFSIPQQNLLVQPVEPVVETNQAQDQAPANEMVPNNLPNLNPRSFGSLFNLSAYLAGAPTNSAALNFIPLITILSAALGSG